jgi:hypothetical protein
MRDHGNLEPAAADDAKAALFRNSGDDAKWDDAVMRLLAAAALIGGIGCAKSDVPPPPKQTPPSATAAVAADTGCPATGLWAECSAVYRIGRAGLAPRVDSAASASEKELIGRPLVLKLGLTAKLELYFYPDSAARIADAKRLDRTQFVDAAAVQTMKRERTLIETANVIGLLTSINDLQRERVSDVLTAGPPQPASP